MNYSYDVLGFTNASSIEDNNMSHKIRHFTIALVLLILLTLPILAVTGDENEAVMTHAASAAPGFISDNATIIGKDGAVLREGSNGWTCLPDTMPGDNAPMCNDATWMALLGAVGSEGEFTASKIGISYMLQGDIGAGISNSDPYHPDHKSAHDYVETGPHLMIVVPKELLEGITDDPSVGGPYVMWKDTPYAHLMVPLSD
jgi:hypothetical protein